MIIYTATKTETKQLNITNVESTQSVVYLNNVIYDNVLLASGTVENPNLRVLEFNLVNGDIISANDNQLITYKMK